MKDFFSPITIKRSGLTNFNDTLSIQYSIDNQFVEKTWKCSSLPGVPWLLKPMNSRGTAIIAKGTYPQSHDIGLHRGKIALVQVGVLDCYFDNNKNDKVDPDKDKVYKITGAGLNIHYSQNWLQTVGLWSAGCIVLPFAAESAEYLEFISHFQKWKKKYPTARFTLSIV